MIRGLIPLRNFAFLDEDKNLYRSAQPLYSYEYNWINIKLGVDTIVNIRSELDHDTKMVINGMKVIDFNVPDHCTPTLNQALEFIEIIRNGRNILFHCEHGRGRTSTFCVLARLAMGWTLDEAIKEEIEVFEYRFQHPKQLDFLKKHFDGYNKK